MPQEILVITRNFPPMTGGMEKVMWNVFESLKEQYVCTVIGPKNSAESVKPPHTAVECNEASHAEFLACAAAKAWKLSAGRRFRLVIAGSGFIGPVCALLQRGRRIPSLIFLHGLDIVAANPAYRTLWLPCLRRSDVIVVNSENTKRLTQEAGITHPRAIVVNPGVEYPAKAADPESFKRTHNIEGRKMLLSVGRLVKRKGLLQFIERCMPDLIRQVPRLILVVIGDAPDKAIRREPNLKRMIEAAVRENELTGNVLLLGAADDGVLQSAYEAADAVIFPLLDIPGDVEGFGMVAVEAASHGTPTVAFRCGGITDAVIDQRTGFLVEEGRYDDMTATIRHALTRDAKAAMKAACIGFSEGMSWDRFGVQIRQVIAETLVGAT